MDTSKQRTGQFKQRHVFNVKRDHAAAAAIDGGDTYVILDDGIAAPRHEKQKPYLEPLELTSGADGFVIPPYARYARYSVKWTGRDKDLFQDHLYLFNVVVVLEWKPTEQDREQLKTAFREASELLYDATNGYMAIGQVIIGGIELMPYADIQIMASNRFNARSWVNGLNDPVKYTPIRVGRGIWDKNTRTLIRWDEPIGPPTLVHEWAHYALNLRDEYLDIRYVFRPKDAAIADQSEYLLAQVYPIVIPTISLATESLMATLDATELVPQKTTDSSKRKQNVWQEIHRQYDKVDPYHPLLEGPKLPIDLPRFPTLSQASSADGSYGQGHAGAVGPTSNETPLAYDGVVIMTVPCQEIDDEHCWVYVVKGTADSPGQVVAQGTLDAQSVENGFRLLNAKSGDTLILIGKHPSDNQPIVLKGTIDDAQASGAGGESEAMVVQWQPATPRSFPMVDVLPSPVQADETTTKIRVRITGTEPPIDVRLFPLGQGPIQLQQEQSKDQTWLSGEREVSTLDGHIFMRWNDGSVLICTFSQGGGPATHVASRQSPITAGSSEGNVMLFFKDEDSGNYSSTRVVTTMIQGMPDVDARSYVFSIASNMALPTNLAPTLIMYYDESACAARKDGYDLVIHRLVNGSWQPMITYVPEKLQFAAMPLNDKTAPTLFEQTEQRIERYRLYLMPRSNSGK